MAPEKQQRLYGVLIGTTILLLLAAQYLLFHTFRTASTELASVRGELASLKQKTDSTHSLVERYKVFELVAANPNRPERSYPNNALELYSVVDGALKAQAIEHTNRSSSSGTAPGGTFQLNIAFSGSYYNVIKALASMREAPYVMRISDFRITPQSNGRVTGTMTILSRANG